MKYGFIGLLALAAFSAAQAEVKLEGAFPAGVAPDAAVMAAVTPELKDAELIYALDLRSGLAKNDEGKTMVKYAVDNSAAAKPFKTVGYLVYLVGNDGKVSYAYTTMDAFTDDAKKIGVPTAASGAIFQQKVKNLTVKSNVDGVKNGAFPEGNIEFWPTNYSSGNGNIVEGADPQKFDFDDARTNGGDYGSMQVHNPAEKATVFAFNCWRNGPSSDLGIGSNANGNPDWTFSNAGKNYKNALLFVVTR